MDELRNALIYNPTKNPERTNATVERIFEVLENVLGADASQHINNLNNLLQIKDLRSPINEQTADRIIAYFDKSGLTREQIDGVTFQLQLSEISTAEAIELHSQFKIPVSRPEEDIIPVLGKGCWIMDTKGKWYLDMDSNYSATNLGMANEQIARGLYNQASTLISMKEDRIQIARSRFLKEIHTMMPEGLNQFYWQNSGGEAVDKALKIAKAFTGTTNVIAFKGGFHGRTHGAVAVTWNEKYRKPFGLHQLDWVHFAEFNNLKSVEDLLKQTGAKIIILEMVQGEEAGNLPATPEFIDGLWALAKKHNALIIDDEVQAGFGRTAVKSGDWFACMSYNVTPDIMVIGKSFGGGYPVTAVVTRKEIAEAMQHGYDGSTFGGNPMAMVAALIATRQMRAKNITQNVIERSQQLLEGLKELQQKHPVVGEIRGRGLMVAFDLGSAQNVERVQTALRENGVKASLSTGSFIRFLPPTVISEGEVNYFLEKLDRSLSVL
ncbi:aminotransferase class-III [Caldithrix abyssi DSM 13497]|uniref:Acetylornithine/N-succinyldiaminopimelate aminotransferase/acetylornithine/LysW-gamma-L-lysine aminotransferase n=1 Tax=Caldithrix abyssi DSM 13497 TaxID=880073 RepID=H1XTA1_CALAY|nr:aminotransferase class III-fold pyridoxal phosphate-dependent enzyme [Caldithrix abyssi]APF18684.1 acetylornithine/N-succinyldiaminopimelate aminotransferase/acetylornithine/LysW-gamma-L-lysine aminotransferase [Caldithrix abyssi DSM 13497]EHO42668.1 aminotransferase class-III [Caldithrix abyssi DSM 13497]